MKLVIIAGPPSAGKTAVTRQIIRHFLEKKKSAFLKIDVVRAFEDEELSTEFGIPARKIYSGDLCPDHTGVMVLKDALVWAEGEGADIFIIESAGLCLRCSPYVTQSLGIVVLSAVSGMNRTSATDSTTCRMLRLSSRDAVMSRITSSSAPSSL